MKLTVKLKRDERADLMERAPQACRYWGRFERIGVNGHFAVHQYDEQRDDGKVPLLADTMLDRGVALALARIPSVAQQVAGHNKPQGEADVRYVDQSAADAIIQYAIFGELRYG